MGSLESCRVVGNGSHDLQKNSSALVSCYCVDSGILPDVLFIDTRC